MALILGVKKGDVVYIDQTKLIVTEVHDLLHIDVTVNGDTFSLSDLEVSEVYPSVFMSCGVPARHLAKWDEVIPRLVIEAPREIRILRGDLYGGRKRKEKK